jgi:hypothetical protein
MRVFICAIAFLSLSCARHVTHASSAPGVPYGAVAKVNTEDLARDPVLSAEFHQFQEIDVMAKLAGYIKQINVDGSVGGMGCESAAAHRRSPGVWANSPCPRTSSDYSSMEPSAPLCPKDSR